MARSHSRTWFRSMARIHASRLHKNDVVKQRPWTRLAVERLEDRTAPAVIQWDGGAGTFNWADANNWVGNILPGSSDEAVIGSGFAGITVTSSGNVAIQKLTCAATLQVNGGTFSLTSSTDSSSTTSLSLVGGTLDGAATLMVSGTFAWSDSTMRGTGKTALAATATGTITGGDEYLGRILENAGNLAFSGNRMIVGVSASESGVINNLAGATFTASGLITLRPALVAATPSTTREH